MAKKKDEIRSDNPEDSAPIPSTANPQIEDEPRVEAGPDETQDADPVNTEGEAVLVTVPPLDPKVDAEPPIADENAWLKPGDIPLPNREFSPKGGDYVLAKEMTGDQDGFMFFVQGYPMFLPRHISEDLARFILSE